MTTMQWCNPHRSSVALTLPHQGNDDQWELHHCIVVIAERNCSKADADTSTSFAPCTASRPLSIAAVAEVALPDELTHLPVCLVMWTMLSFISKIV